jgi:hypothetical protein
MLTIYGANCEKVEEPVVDGSVMHPTTYSLLCQDIAGNKLEIKTSKETYVEVSDFLYKLQQV